MRVVEALNIYWSNRARNAVISTLYWKPNALVDIITLAITRYSLDAIKS